MRVLHVIPSVAPRYGGPSEAVAGLAAAQRAAGLDARIATTDADGPGGILGMARGAFVDWRGIPTLIFPRWPGESVKYSPGLSGWMRAHSRDFDVIHLHAFFSHSVVAGARAARRGGQPYFVRPLGTLSRYGLRRHGARKRLFLAAWGRSVLNGAAGIHCTSPEERVEVESFGATRAFVAPLGVCEVAAAAMREPMVLFLSRLDPKKNVEDLIGAFHAVVSRFPSWRLVIAGAGDADYERRLRSRAAEGPGADRIVFAGWADEAARGALLARASLFAIPSRHENFGIAVAEAMAAGVPVVVSEGVDLAGPVRETGCGWAYGEGMDALAGAMAEAMGDEAERTSRGEAARAVARERFGWARCVETLSGEYERSLMAGAA